MYFCWSGQLHICFGNFDPSGYSCHRPQELGRKGLKSSSVEVGMQRMSERKKHHRPLTFSPGSCAVAFLPPLFQLCNIACLVYLLKSKIHAIDIWALLYCFVIQYTCSKRSCTVYSLHCACVHCKIESRGASGFNAPRIRLLQMPLKVSITFIQSKFVRALWSSYCRRLKDGSAQLHFRPADQLSRRSHRSIWKSWIAMESQTEGLRCCLTHLSI